MTGSEEDDDVYEQPLADMGTRALNKYLVKLHKNLEHIPQDKFYSLFGKYTELSKQLTKEVSLLSMTGTASQMSGSPL